MEVRKIEEGSGLTERKRYPARPPLRTKTNAESRPREFLYQDEVERVIQAARNTKRNGVRNKAMLVLMHAHALRSSELIELRWEQVDLERSLIHIVRKKGSDSGTHFLSTKERQMLKRYGASITTKVGPVFVNIQGHQFTQSGIHKIVVLAGQAAGIPFPIHPHMLRHSKGYQLADKGTDLRLIQGYMGHKTPNMTVRYTQINPARFKGLEA